MKKISSNWTFFQKVIFPCVWFGMLLFIFGNVFFDAYQSNQLELGMFFPFFVMIIGGILVIKFTVWDLVNEVYDLGDSLLVKNKGKETKISYNSILNISQSFMMNPPKATVMLYEANELVGKNFSFIPIMSKSFFGAFKQNEEVTALIYKVDDYKRKHHR